MTCVKKTMEARVQALLEAADSFPSERIKNLVTYRNY
jgi:hypothetical protein